MNNKRRRFQKSKKVESTINPQLLIKKATKSIETKYIVSKSFADFSLDTLLLKNLETKGYTLPTEVQEKTLSNLIVGNDLIGIAATGTGKTGAFLIPLIHRILKGELSTALIVVPTRELAQQVWDEFKSLTKNLNLYSACFIGGTNVRKDISIAKKKLNMVVGTPGRINDLMNRKALKLHTYDALVLDEFDRMLDMGFINDINKISTAMKNRNQTLLFSATVDKSQNKLIRNIVHNPIKINITNGLKSSDNVDQSIIEVKRDENKFDLLLDLINDKSLSKVILFAETKRVVDKLSKQLSKSGVKSDVIHGDKSQNYRTRAIDLFKRGKVKVLVATDVAARGIDIKGVTHVINYQLPKTMDSYIHRIGRTGRAETSGTAYTFVN
ncbi:MAG: DEAD/DEAH box helicase [Cytophagales bacterium]|nr:DEAD/DEAH box helicase [Cytophagales bacterium]